MSRVNVYTTKGTKKGIVNMPKNFGEPINKVLLAQAIRVYENRKHPGLSKTKRRGEVSLSTRKIYRQKGTGLARHGAKSAPIFVGGGLAHGPKGVKRTLKLPKKMREKALNVALSMKAKNGSIFVIEKLEDLKKTKDAASLLEKIVAKVKDINKNPVFMFVLPDDGKNAKLAVRNLKNTVFMNKKEMNAYDVFYSDIIVMDKSTLKDVAKKKSTDERKSKKSN